MIIKPSITALLDKVSNKYSLVIGTAKRARQISQGSKKLVATAEMESDVTTAAMEINEDKIFIEK